jgi:hypothetical protein
MRMSAIVHKRLRFKRKIGKSSSERINIRKFIRSSISHKSKFDK